MTDEIEAKKFATNLFIIRIPPNVVDEQIHKLHSSLTRFILHLPFRPILFKRPKFLSLFEYNGNQIEEVNACQSHSLIIFYECVREYLEAKIANVLSTYNDVYVKKMIGIIELVQEMYRDKTGNAVYGSVTFKSHEENERRAVEFIYHLQVFLVQLNLIHAFILGGGNPDDTKQVVPFVDIDIMLEQTDLPEYLHIEPVSRILCNERLRESVEYFEVNGYRSAIIQDIGSLSCKSSSLGIDFNKFILAKVADGDGSEDAQSSSDQ